MQTPEVTLKPFLLRAKDCAKVAAVSVATWWSWVNDGLVPKGHKISQQITVWRSDEVEESLNQLVPRRRVAQ